MICNTPDREPEVCYDFMIVTDRVNLLIMYVINVPALRCFSSQTLLLDLSAFVTLSLTQMQSFSSTLFRNYILGALTVHHVNQNGSQY